MKYFVDNSTNNNYPKTLLIHNTAGGMVWQIYHVKSEAEANNLSKNADGNGFQYRQLIDYTGEEETFSGWRDTQSGIF